MNKAEIESVLKSMVILVDTREHPTAEAKRRWERFGVPYERKAIRSGDYSARFTMPDGSEFSLEKICVIERKMSLGEICNNFCSGRARFTREFERLKISHTKAVILVENATWENILNGKYRSKMTPQSLLSSMLAWVSRYNAVPIFCKAETAPRMIKEILYREAREILEQMTEEGETNGIKENVCEDDS